MQALAARDFERLVSKGVAARSALGDGALLDAGLQREVEAFSSLQAVRDLLLAVALGRLDEALAKLQELNFLPLERARWGEV